MNLKSLKKVLAAGDPIAQAKTRSCKIWNAADNHKVVEERVRGTAEISSTEGANSAYVSSTITKTPLLRQEAMRFSKSEIGTAEEVGLLGLHRMIRSASFGSCSINH